MLHLVLISSALLQAPHRLLPAHCARATTFCATQDVPDEPQTAPMAISSTSPAPTDVAVNAGLFVLLHTLTLSSAQLFGGTDRMALALARLASTGAFVGVQAAAPGGAPLEEWLTVKSSSTTSVAAPVAFACAFAAATVAVSTTLAVVAGGADVAGALAAALPPARPLDDAGRAVDLLLAAPLQEELFFRAWLLTALTRPSVGLPDAAALALSSVAFALWHGGPAVGGAELLELTLLGGFLGVLYTRVGQRGLALPVATHAAYNAIVLLLGAARA